MNISIWDIFKYLYKWKMFIVAAVVLSALLAYVYVNKNQTYNATAVIQLNDSCITKGQAPDGSKYDHNEIVSPNVMIDVIEDLKLSKTVDSLRTRISITPIIPQTEIEIQESKEKTGEKHEYYPNTFSVVYTGRSGESASQTRDILESVVDNYIEFYTEKYSHYASINDLAYNEEMGAYDYIEMVDMITVNLDDIIKTMDSYYEKDNKFRSTTTGMSFSDISKEYKYLYEFTVPGIYTDICRGKLTKNRDLLINTYSQKKEKHLLDKELLLDAASIAKSRMDSYSKANKDVPNAYNRNTNQNSDELAIIHEVHDEINPNNTVTTYDTLINDYVDKLAAANDRQLQADHCDEIISVFSSGTVTDVDVEVLTQSVSEELSETKLKMEELAKTANKIINDYNAYVSTAHVSPLTGVNYYAILSFSLYALIAVIAGGFLSVIVALTFEIIKAVKAGEKNENSDSE